MSAPCHLALAFVVPGAREAAGAARALAGAWLVIQPEPCGPDLLREKLLSARPSLVLDVSHPFDAETSSTAAEAARAVGATYVSLRRPLWTSLAEEEWARVNSSAEALAHLPPKGRVFAATGRESLPDLAPYDGRIFLRQTTLHNDPPLVGNTEYVFGTPPFTVEEEEGLFHDLRIDAVLFRNLGGTRGMTKLTAARNLRLPIVMIQPPDPPPGIHLVGMDALDDWLAHA